jgi:hypothetical protein
MAFGDLEHKHAKEEPQAKEPEVDLEPKTHKIHVKRVAAKEEKPKADIETGLRAIYQDEDGDMPDMTRLDRKKSRGWLMAILFLVAMGLVSGLVWVGFLVFSPYVMNANAKLAVHVDAPETAGSFEETHITVSYENISQVDIAGGEIRVNIPQEFHLTASDPLGATDGSTWPVPELAPGEKGHISLTGYFIGENGVQAFMQAVARYRPVGIKAQYEDIATKTVSLASSQLDISVDVPTETVAGEKTSFTYHVKNSAGMKIENISFDTKLPASFLISDAKPKPDADGSWALGALEPGQEAKITVTGTFSANHEDNENIGGSVKIKKGAFVAVQGQTVTPVKVISSDFELRTLANGSIEDQAVDFGGRVRVSSIYKNNGKSPMKDATLTVTIDATPDGLIDWKKFDEETKDDKTFARKGETITVNTKLQKAFEEIAPGAEGSLSWNLPLVAAAIPGTAAYNVRILSHASIGMIGKTKVAKSVDTTPFTLTPNTDLTLSGGSAYFDGEDSTFGSGPLPPIVGEATKYAVLWTIANSVHDVKDVSLKTQLAEGVEWADETNTEGGSLSYDAGTRTVTWKIDTLVATTPTITAQFKVTITPKSTQVDSYAPLTTGATLSATDTVTKSILTRTTDPDTTECPTDEKVKDKGLVAPEPKTP